MDSGEIRNWLGILAVVVGAVWTYFELTTEVDNLRARLDELPPASPDPLEALREAERISVAGQCYERRELVFCRRPTNNLGMRAAFVDECEGEYSEIKRLKILAECQ
jgi:hypothetical protein